MDKKQKKMVATILIISLIILCLIGYTFTEYHSVYAVQSTTEIAKYNFKLNDWKKSKTKEIKLINTAENIDLEEGKIVPGTKGEFEVEIDAGESQVDVAYNVQATETGNKPSNLVFTVEKDRTASGKEYSSIKELVEEEIQGKIKTTDTTKKISYKIYWEWPYETYKAVEATNAEKSTYENIIQDDADMLAGEGTESGKDFDYTFFLKVIGTQVKK